MPEHQHSSLTPEMSEYPTRSFRTLRQVAQPGGTFYFHEGVLYNGLAFALAKDALTHPGPGDLSRINVVAECQKIAADGLSVADILATEATIPIAAYEIVAYPNKTTVEPPIMPYSQKDIPK